MRRLPALILTALALTLSACKADRTSQRSSTLDSQSSDLPQNQLSPQPPPTPQPPPPNDTRPLIVCFGDSLTAGFGTDPGQSYPDFLQSALDSRGFHYRVLNEGISGNTTKDGVNRLNAILALHPAITIVEFGGNDGLRGLPIADSRANLDKIVAALKASGTRVILAGITLPLDYGPDYIRQFDETYTLLAKKYKVPLLPFLLQNVATVPGMMQNDHTHATAAGNKIVANNVLPYVEPLLKK